jgi:hypothetical protein
VTRVYATPAQLAAYTGQPAPDDAEQLLAGASRMLDAEVLRLAVYATSDDGMPSDPLVAAAFTAAVCAQVVWWGKVGDSTGAAGAGWGNVSIGSVSLGRGSGSTGSPDGSDSAARQIAPQAWDALRDPALTPDRLLIGSAWAP